MDKADDANGEGDLATKKHAVYTRVPEALYQKLVKAAERDRRSVSSYVLKLIVRDVEKR